MLTRRLYSSLKFAACFWSLSFSLTVMVVYGGWSEIPPNGRVLLFGAVTIVAFVEFLLVYFIILTGTTNSDVEKK